MKICKLIDFFWPTLCGPQSTYREVLLPEIKIDEANIDKTLDLVLKVYDSERERIKTVENKSLVFIAVTGAIAALSINFSKNITTENCQTSILGFVNYVLLLAVIIYLIRTVWLAVNALKRKSYNTLGFKDVLLNQERSKRDLILSIINKTRSNYNAINSKVDNMTLAQGFFQRAVFLFSLYVLLIFLQYTQLSALVFPKIRLPTIYTDAIILLLVLFLVLIVKVFFLKNLSK